MRGIWRAGRATKAGMILIGIGILAPASVFLWMITRIGLPVDEPIILTPRHLEAQFKLNFTDFYDIEIVCKRKLPFETLQCLLGLHDGYDEGLSCEGTPAVLRVRWKLTSNGVTLKEGSTPGMIGGNYYGDSIGAELTNFLGKSGRHYALAVDILQDGSPLAITQPRLRVELDGFSNEDLIMLGFESLIFGAVCIIIGTIFLLVGFARRGSKAAPAGMARVSDP